MTDVAAPDAFDLFLKEASAKFDQAETADVIHELKRLYSTRRGLFDQNDLYGALKQLYKLGAIDDDGDAKILEIMAEKSSKKGEVFKLISGYRESVSTCKTDFVGRDDDVSKILKRVTNPHVPGINLFGESGVGKTTLAKEVAQKLKDFERVFIDLRDIKAVHNVYAIVLFKLNLPSWDNNKDRIYKHLQNLTRDTVLILDNIEQLLLKEKQPHQERVEFLEFLDAIVGSEASKEGHLKIILTSRTEIKESKLKDKLFTEYNVQPFSKDVSKALISKRFRSDVSYVEQEEALVEIVDLCRNNAYLLHVAEQLMREDYSQPKDVLNKIKNKLGSFQKFACISASFDSLPSDHLKEVAIKISLLHRPFSVSTAMKIAEIPSDYDAQWDLELLVIHKILTAKDVNGKRKYDLHALFREFVTSYLCKEDSIYNEHLKRGEKQFFEHFSGKLTNLAHNLETEFVITYSKLEKNRPNFVLVTILYEQHIDSLPDDLVPVLILLEIFTVDVAERRKLFGELADAAKKKGKLLASTILHCWELLTTYYSEVREAKNAFKKATNSLKEAQASYSHELLKEGEVLYNLARGRLELMFSAKAKNAKEKAREHLFKGIDALETSLNCSYKIYGKHTVTARILLLLGDCQLEFGFPEKSMTYYQKAIKMKMQLVGSEKHYEILIYYNNLARAHQMLGRAEKEKWYSPFFGSKKKAREEYGKSVAFMRKALALQDELGVGDTIHTATFQRNLANILIGLGKYDHALESAKKSYELRQYLLGQHPETVRILYLIGVIHEWRKDPQAALQSYEKAFVMEESLPNDNHSVVRKLLCDRFEEMCKKLNKKDKFEEYGPRLKVIKETRSPAVSPIDEYPAFSFHHQRESKDCKISREHLDKVSPSSVSHEKENVGDDSTGSVDQELENKDDECCGILINISIKKKCSFILPSLDSDDCREPLRVSCEVFKKIGIDEKRVTFTVQSNGCGQGPVQESELIGYERLAPSETEACVGKEAYMRISVTLGNRFSKEFKWHLKHPILHTFPLEMEKSEEQEREKQLKLCVSLDSEKELIFEIPITIDIAQGDSEALDHVGMSKSLSCSTKVVPSPIISSLTLSHNQKRWLVIGICLNKTLLPTLRDFIKPEMDKHYADLKRDYNIDKQSDARHLEKDGKHHLNYESINNNAEKKKKKDYDYEVKSAVALAKLYLKPFMAKFTGLDDTCDMSAVLGIFSSASVFPADIQNLAGKIRQEVRNAWGHCNFQDWNEAKFEICFQLMEDLLQALKLPSDEEQKTVNELKDWQIKGVAYCMGNPVDETSLLEFIEFSEVEINRLSQEVKRLDRSQHEEAEKIVSALKSIREACEKDKEEITRRIEALEQRVEHHDGILQCHGRDIEALKLANQNKEHSAS